MSRTPDTWIIAAQCAQGVEPASHADDSRVVGQGSSNVMADTMPTPSITG